MINICKIVNSFHLLHSLVARWHRGQHVVHKTISCVEVVIFINVWTIFSKNFQIFFQKLSKYFFKNFPHIFSKIFQIFFSKNFWIFSSKNLEKFFNSWSIFFKKFKNVFSKIFEIFFQFFFENFQNIFIDIKGVNLKTSHFILGIYLLFHGPLYNFHNCYPNKYESPILKVSKMGWNISVGENSAEIWHFKDR